MSGAALPPSQSVAPSWSSLGACGPHGGVTGDFREGSLASGHLPGLLPPLPLTPCEQLQTLRPEQGRQARRPYRAFPLRPGARKTFSGPSKNGVSVSPSPLEVL